MLTQISLKIFEIFCTVLEGFFCHDNDCTPQIDGKVVELLATFRGQSWNNKNNFAVYK